MKILDYLFYLIFRFTHLKLKQDKAQSKFSALLFTAVYFILLLMILICSVGLLFENSVSDFFKRTEQDLAWLSLGGISPLILSFRYYKKSILSNIESKYLSKSKSQKWVIKVGILILMILIPVSAYVTFRLYVIGHISV